MFLQPAIHGAAAQSQSLRRLAHISFVARECALDEIPLNFIEAHFLQLGRAARGLRAQTEVCRADRRARREEHAAFHRMIEFANIARPGMLMKSLDGGGVEAGNVLAIALRVTVEKMVCQEIDVLTAILSAAVTQYAFTIAAVGTQIGALVLGSETIAYLQAGALQAIILYMALAFGLICGYAGIRTAAQIARQKAA